MDDGKLLTLYVRDRSEAAFGQIITRHRALVYMTCLRETGSPSQAEDAAQVVFLLLSRKSKSLRPGPSLAGWLFRTARFVAKDVRKQEARRLRREEIVQEELTPRPKSPAPEWQRIEPLLNGALSALRPADRELILLRFLEGLSLSETGAALGLSEVAARMRVTRAIEKMRRWLAAHGAAVSGLALVGFLTAEAARPIPARAAEALPSANVLLLSKGVSHTMKIIQVKVAALAAFVVLGGIALPPLAHAFIPHKLAVQTLAVPSLRQVTTAQVPGTQTIVLQHRVAGEIVKSQHWDQLASLPTGVTKIEVVQAQNALAVTTTPAGFAKVQALIKQLDVEPRQVKIVSAMARVSDADLKASGIKFEVAPLTGPASIPAIIVYASGPSAIQLLQTLTKKHSVTQMPDITTANDVSAHIDISTAQPGGASLSQQIDVNPHVNNDNSITLAFHPRFVDGAVTHEANTTRTIKNGDTMVMVMSFGPSQNKDTNMLFFATPTVK